jgi:hypothetical protein
VKNLLGKLPEAPKNTQDNIYRAVASARADIKGLKEMRDSGRGLGVTSDEAKGWVDPRDVVNAGGDMDW